MNFLYGKIIQENGLKFVENGSALKLYINPEYTPRLEKYKDKPVILGIRPEDIHVFDASKVDSSQKFIANIEVGEPMGNEIFIYFNIGDTQIVGRLPSFVNVKRGDLLDLFFDISKLHFFDVETEMAIS